MISIKRGLNVPLSGSPRQEVGDRKPITQVALLGQDYIGMKPTMLVQEGDTVALGQKLFEDKKNPGVFYTAPAAGKIAAINRGDRRVFRSLVIDIDDSGEKRSFNTHTESELNSLNAKVVADQLIESGLWTALRTRPYSKVPSADSQPAAIFVSAMDTNPLAGDPALVISHHQTDFGAGLAVLSRLTSGSVYVGKAVGSSLPEAANKNIKVEEFSGPHPSGLVGTHIHKLFPAAASRVVWTIGYQDVVAVGILFLKGELWMDRLVSLAGPQVENPRVIKSRLGASLEEITKDELKEGESRIISGSVLAGAASSFGTEFLGRYQVQVSVLQEGRDRTMLHYALAGKERYSALPIYISSLDKKRQWNLTTTTNGSDRAMVPIGAYELVMPLDILPTQLLRALIVGDTETAQDLGALELDEEDLALCTFVCPGKYEFGPILRDNLTRIEQEG
jgi:Na+-transporting NADH:ubiquinone oxidoreductase subunit A